MGAVRFPLVILILCSASCACDDDRAVPFKRPGSSDQAAPGQGAPQSAPAVPDGPREGRSFPEGTARLELPEAPAFEHPDGLVLAALEADLDTDGDADLLLVTRARPAAEGEADAPLAARLERVERTKDAWSAPVALQPLGDERCAVKGAGLRALGPQLGLASLTLGCRAEAPPDAAADVAASAAAAPEAPPEAPPAPADEAPPPPPAPEGEPGLAAAPAHELPLEEHRVIGLGRNPRQLFRFGIEPGELARVEASFASSDQDEDGHADVKLGLRVTPVAGVAQGQTVELELALLNRPGGMARDSEQPEQILLALANDAKRARKGKPEVARVAAERALTTHRALCREGDEAVVHVGGQRGLPCGISLGAGRAASVLSAVAAAQGRLREALALARLAQDGTRHRLTDNDRDRIDYAFEAVVERSPTGWRRGPAITLPSAPTMRRPALAFIDEQRVLVRGPSPQSYELSTGQLSPMGISADLPLREPSGARVITDLFRSCEGYRLRVAAAGMVVAGLLTVGAPIAEPLVLPAPPPAGARCPGELPAHLREQRGELRALAWTRSGVLLDRAGELLLLELDSAGQARAPARALTASEPIPRLQHSTALTPDGAWLALPVPRGVLVIDRRAGKDRLLPLPEGAGPASDVALSPSGKRMALLAAGHLWVAGAPEITPAAADTPPAPEVLPPPPAPPEPESPDEG